MQLATLVAELLRPQGGRQVRLRRRRRLDNRAHLHRLRPPQQRRHDLHVRVDAHVPGRGEVLGHGAAAQVHAVLHGTDGDQVAHAIRG